MKIGRDSGRLAAVVQEEGRVCSDRVWRPVVRDFDVDKVQIPIALVVVDEATQHFVHVFVHNLGLPVRLRMIGGRRTNFDIQDVREGFPKVSEEDRIAATHHVNGKAVIPVNMLVEAIHYDVDAVVTARGQGQRCNEVHGDACPSLDRGV